MQPIASIASPISAGTATIRLKAKSDNTIFSANDYTDTLTVIAAMVY